MKKSLLLVLMFSFFFFGCQKNDVSTVDVSTVDFATITDLSKLEPVILQVSKNISDGTLSMDQAQKMTTQLEEKYLALTKIPEKNIETSFATLKKAFDNKSFTLSGLPLWAKRLGMTEPQKMQLNTTLSTYNVMKGSGISTTMIYTGDYYVALQQAKRISRQAHLYLSKNFEQAQSLAKGNVDYISGLDISDISQGIVYVNHDLLDTNIDELLAVSVDKNGTLTIETTQYKNN